MTTLAVDAQTGLRAQYDRDGWVAARGVLDEGLVAEARSHVDWLLAKHPDMRPEQLHHQLMTDDPFWVRLISDPRMLDVAQQFIGPDIALFASHYIAKRPYDGQSVLWHQDGSFWPLEPMEVVTLWLAVDDADVENGCLRVLPGTQNQRLLTLDEMEKQDDGRNVLGTGIRPSDLDESRAVDVILKAGDVEIHHPNIIHGSNANTSPRRRWLTSLRLALGSLLAALGYLLGKDPSRASDELRGLAAWVSGRGAVGGSVPAARPGTPAGG